MKSLIESSVELRGRHDDTARNAQVYLADWLEPRGQHSHQRGGSGYQGGKTRFAYFAAHDLDRQLRTKLRPHLRGAILNWAVSRSVASALTRLRCRSRPQFSLHFAPDQPRRIGLGFSA